MARWRLTDGHYLNVPGTEWEYKETDRETGRAARKVYEVPLYLHPNVQADWNDKVNECITVSNRYDPAHPLDYVFVGPPTPDMEALDDEAREISQGYVDRGEWKHPIDALNMTYSQSMLSEFEMEIARKVAGGIADRRTNSVSTKGIDPADFERLQEQVAKLMERNAQLEKLTGVKRRA